MRSVLSGQLWRSHPVPGPIVLTLVAQTFASLEFVTESSLPAGQGFPATEPGRVQPEDSLDHAGSELPTRDPHPVFLSTRAIRRCATDASPLSSAVAHGFRIHDPPSVMP